MDYLAITFPQKITRFIVFYLDRRATLLIASLQLDWSPQPDRGAWKDLGTYSYLAKTDSSIIAWIWIIKLIDFFSSLRAQITKTTVFWDCLRHWIPHQSYISFRFHLLNLAWASSDVGPFKPGMSQPTDTEFSHHFPWSYWLIWSIICLSRYICHCFATPLQEKVTPFTFCNVCILEIIKQMHLSFCYVLYSTFTYQILYSLWYRFSCIKQKSKLTYFLKYRR